MIDKKLFEVGQAGGMGTNQLGMEMVGSGGSRRPAVGAGGGHGNGCDQGVKLL